MTTPLKSRRPSVSNQYDSASYWDSIASRRTSANSDGDSLASFGLTDDGASDFQAADACEPDAAHHSEPPSPFDSMLLNKQLAVLQDGALTLRVAQARGTRAADTASPFDGQPPRTSPGLAMMLQGADRGRAAWQREAGACRPAAGDDPEPSSPLGSMLLRAKRRNSFSQVGGLVLAA